MVLVAAIACAALRGGDWFWARAMFSVTAVIMLSAILAAIYRTGATRACWIGFALFGWAYLLSEFLPASRLVEHHLPSTQVDAWLREYSSETSLAYGVDLGGGRVVVTSFQQILHSIFALICAVVGGFVGRYFYRTRNGGQPPRADE